MAKEVRLRQAFPAPAAVWCKWLIITVLPLVLLLRLRLRLDIGKSEFQSSCRSCSMYGCKGRGPVSAA